MNGPGFTGALIAVATVVVFVPWALGVGQFGAWADDYVRDRIGEFRARRAAKRALASRAPWVAGAPDPLPPVDSRDRDVPLRDADDSTLPQRRPARHTNPTPIEVDDAVTSLITAAIRECRNAGANH